MKNKMTLKELHQKMVPIYVNNPTRTNYYLKQASKEGGNEKAALLNLNELQYIKRKQFGNLKDNKSLNQTRKYKFENN